MAQKTVDSNSSAARRVRGTQKAPRKVALSLRIQPEILAAFQASDLAESSWMAFQDWITRRLHARRSQLQCFVNHKKKALCRGG
ncbi:hypothetical protein Tamer19_43220 [Cupriavidus sp. TA19]|uniref:hypothetical protein n=1 Tax=unclassified Cupriavidus TaxID=2640874 RepID=UPI0027294C14|nr:hypothetical protein [Cupriavidus sp. TA19]GLC94914.1 hypothetical protein Tamer19_43220 [Cupriavidus sp. TA19]